MFIKHCVIILKLKREHIESVRYIFPHTIDVTTVRIARNSWPLNDRARPGNGGLTATNNGGEIICNCPGSLWWPQPGGHQLQLCTVELHTNLREILGLTVMEKALTRAFSLWKANTTVFTFNNLLRLYATCCHLLTERLYETSYAHQPALMNLWPLQRWPKFYKNRTSNTEGGFQCPISVLWVLF